MKLVLILAAVFSTGISDDNLPSSAQLDQYWKEFKETHSKKYVSDAEEKERLRHWILRYSKVAKHNKEALSGKHTFLMSLNDLSDMSTQELKQRLGARLPAIKAHAKKSENLWFNSTERQNIPSTVDLRSNKCMPAVKNQRECGSCWAFSANTPFEYALCKKTGKMTTLSEQQLVDCTRTYGNLGCDGGWVEESWDYVIKAPGQASSAKYPYTATNGTCKYKKSMSVGRIVKYSTTAGSTTAIQKAVATIGPVATYFQVLDSFYSYSSGVYSDADCPTDDETINHAVVIVGYGQSNKIPHWIVRNSWGPTWGLKGYGLVKRGVNMCNIEYSSSFVTSVA